MTQEGSPHFRRRRPVMVLPEDVVRRIAAGEVIVRPANAVKELVENAIDAGATRVKVEIKAGGKNLIRVSDNGWGMSREDIQLAITRHATSKLRTIEDLRRIESFGFRGEALASIAAVSRMSIESSVQDGGPGTAIEVEGGEVRELRECCRNQGTTVTVRALFYNLPVRRAFLKSDNYESRLVAEVLRAYALAFPQIAFEYVSNERVVARLAPVTSLRERIAAVVNRSVADSFVEIRGEHPTVSVRGLVAEPSQTKSYYDLQGIYFNNRPVRSLNVVRAVYEGYGPILGANNPNFLLFIDTDPAQLDVNLHPTKQEVQFSDARFLFDFVAETVRKGLGIRRFDEADAVPAGRGFAAEDSTPQDFWQLHNTYILAQVATGYVVVDQHAAHERILFEEALRGQERAASQGLLFPVTVELTAEQFEAYQRVAERLAEMGLESRSFSGNTVVVETVPAGSYLGKDELHELLAGLTTVLSTDVSVSAELAKLLACKGAIKAGQRLSTSEMESLINRLFSCREPYFCPHGRPAIIKITLDDLGRRFGRQ